jgi:predicted DNA-binding protein with PD1-like motif
MPLMRCAIAAPLLLLSGLGSLTACQVSAQTGAAVSAKTPSQSQPPPPVASVDPTSAQIENVYRLGLRPGDLLLESIQKFIKDKGIQDGAILTGIGSVGECSFQFPERPESPPPMKSGTYQGPLEITGMQGIIADFEPHLHMSVAERGHERLIGGHLGPNCRVLYLAEITIAKFAGPPMTRKPNEYGVKLLQVK